MSIHDRDENLSHANLTPNCYVINAFHASWLVMMMYAGLHYFVFTVFKPILSLLHAFIDKINIHVCGFTHINDKHVSNNFINESLSDWSTLKSMATVFCIPRDNFIHTVIIHTYVHVRSTPRTFPFTQCVHIWAHTETSHKSVAFALCLWTEARRYFYIERKKSRTLSLLWARNVILFFHLLRLLSSSTYILHLFFICY